MKLQGDVNVAALSPLLRGMILSASYADSQGGIGLTATGTMNRKFVHWAAVHFQWPLILNLYREWCAHPHGPNSELRARHGVYSDRLNLHP
ncbi:hypothetical protein [Rhizobium leguminosarum]|uniref:hypothetical protein n=1 Tax=Rhizobium leguminosarum TaxID=384 RepID=UPI001649CBAF|nr:hypothetical protein [Rhizobium leguminosarum]